jgi:hypothetical protein
VDLLRAEAAGLALEQREHLLARAARAVARARQLAARVRAPVRGLLRVGGHHDSVAADPGNENGLQ